MSDAADYLHAYAVRAICKARCVYASIKCSSIKLEAGYAPIYRTASELTPLSTR